MKKIFVSIIVIVMIVGMMVGCSSEVETSESEPIIAEDYSAEPTTEHIAIEPVETEPVETKPVETEPQFPMKGIALVDRLNVREEPDINCHVEYQLDIGEEIEVFEIKILDAIPWGRIENNMWVNLRYVNLEDENYDFTVQVDYNLDDLHDLAIVCYMEAGGDICCDLCRLRICDVVLNRVEDNTIFANEDTIEKVLTSQTQFAYFWKLGVVWPDRYTSMHEQHAIERAYMAAEQIMLGNHTDVYQNGYFWYQGINRTEDYIRCGNCGHYWFSR